MAAGAWQTFGNAIEQIVRGVIDVDTDAFRMILVDANYTPAIDTHTAYSDVSADEVTGTGYSQYGNLLTMAVSRSGGTTTVDCDDQSWANSTITAKYAVVVHNDDGTGTLDPTDLLVAYSDLDDGGGSVSTTDGTFAVNISASGVVTLARAA